MQAAGWRMEDVYQDLLPPLCALARQCGLKLVFKLHPFESIKGHRNLLRKLLPQDQLAEIQWIVGPSTAELWSKIRFAMTVESTHRPGMCQFVKSQFSFVAGYKMVMEAISISMPSSGSGIY